MNTNVKYECPECKRPLVSRRHKECQHCGAELPGELLYTNAEIEAQNRAWVESEKNRKARDKERDEEESKNSGDGGAGAAGMMGMI